MKYQKRFGVSIKDFQTRREQLDRSTHLPTSYLIILLNDRTRILSGIFNESFQSIENDFVSLIDHSHIDPSKSPNEYVIRDTLFALVPRPPFELILEISKISIFSKSVYYTYVEGSFLQNFFWRQ